MSADERSEIFQRVLEGSNPKLQLLAAEGVLPVAPEELMALQVRLSLSGDATVAERARASLSSLDLDWLRAVLRDTEDTEVLSFFCQAEHNQLIREVALQNRYLPSSAMELVVGEAGPEIQEIVLLRQDLLREQPELLDLLEQNPDLSRYAARRIAEYRQHLVAPTVTPVPATSPEEDDARSVIAALLAEDEEVTEGEAEELLEQVDVVLSEVEPEGEVDEDSKLSEGQIRALPAAVKLKLARGASRTVRGILLKDPSPQVAVAVIQGAAVTELEAEQISANRHVCDEVLTQIARRREWVRKYGIVHNLVRNPKTPVGIAIKFLSRLSVRDLSRLKSDRNIPDAVRQKAVRMHLSKSR